MRGRGPIIVLLGLAVASGPALGQALGRLFLTPEQRAELNEIRLDPNFGKVAAPAAMPIEPTAPGTAVPNVTINGVVFRSSGANSSWINGSSVPSSDSTREGIRIESRRLAGGSTVKLTLPGGLETVEIKPGQKIDLSSGGVFEPYELKAAEDAPLFQEAGSPDDAAAAEDDVAPSP